MSLAFGLCFGAPVLSGEVFGARIVPHSRHPKHRPLIVKDFGKAWELEIVQGHHSTPRSLAPAPFEAEVKPDKARRSATAMIAF